jgi:hypothetical protein
MQRILPVIYFSLISCIPLFAQQVPNGSIETWTNGEPDQWKTSNQSIPLVGNITTVSKDISNPQSGTSSAKLTVVKTTIPFVGTYNIPGVLTLGKLNIDIAAQTATVTGGTPFTGMPLKLSGYYKYQPVNNDMCVMGWGLTKWNNGIRDTIGYGAIDTNVILNSWTYFEISLKYLMAETPDTMNIIILNSNPFDGVDHTGTNMWVDNLSFLYGTVGIEAITFSKELNIYAEPYARQLVLSSTFAKPENLDIGLFNMAGIETRHWKRTMLKSTERLDLGNLTPGTYVIRISTANRLVDTRKITILN